MIFQPMETPLVLSGLGPEAIRFWQQQTAGTALETVAAGGSIPLGLGFGQLLRARRFFRGHCAALPPAGLLRQHAACSRGR